VNDGEIPFLFPSSFSEWVTLPKRYWVSLAKRPGAESGFFLRRWLIRTAVPGQNEVYVLEAHALEYFGYRHLRDRFLNGGRSELFL